MKKMLIVWGLVLSAAVAQARLGESAAELQTRFGPPLKQTPSKIAGVVDCEYRNKDLVIVISIFQGKSVVERYLRKNPMPLQLAAAILQANSEGSQWNEQESSSVGRRLVRADKKALAVVAKEGDLIRQVEISSVEFLSVLEHSQSR